jgi:hypothetical protein
VAEQEILMTLAMIIARFGVECIEWATLDGKSLDREVRDDPGHDGVPLPHRRIER